MKKILLILVLCGMSFAQTRTTASQEGNNSFTGSNAFSLPLALTTNTTPIAVTAGTAKAYIKTATKSLCTLDDTLTEKCYGTGTLSGTLPSSISCSGTDKVSAYDSGTGTFTCSAVSGGGTPASPDTSVQFNDGGLFGGSSRFTFSKTLGRALIVSTPASSPSGGSIAIEGVAQDDGAHASQVKGLSGSATSSATIANGGMGDVLGVEAYAEEASPDAAPTDLVAGVRSHVQLGTLNSAITNAALFYGKEFTTLGSTPTNAYGLKLPAITGGTNNYGIKIGDVGNFTANDYAIQTGFGRVTFGYQDHGVDDFIFDPDGSTAYGAQNFQVNSQADVIFGDASTNAHTVKHTQFYSSGNFPGMVMSTVTGSGQVPQIDLYGNTNHTYIDSGIFTIINHSGLSSTITTTNTGGDSPATGNSTGLTISATGSGATNTGLALELTGSGSDYEHSIALQVDSGGRALLSGGMQLNTTVSKPTCNSTIRGTFWDVQGAAGVADVIQVCMKDAANAYAWHTVTIP